MESDGWEMIDLDRGRKLERFGAATIVRPAPAARDRARESRATWESIAAEFVREGRQGEWVFHRPLPDPWIVRSAGRDWILEATPSGQIGFFPEQEAARRRLEKRLRAWSARVRDAGDGAPNPMRVLDLFSYTGGGAIAAAAAGAEVVAVDSVKGLLSWAKRNAERNGLAGAPIRWIPEDAARFCEREARRGSRYDAVVLDPPSFGRGPSGRTWKIERDLEPLLERVGTLLSDRPATVLVTMHTTDWTPPRLAGIVSRVLGARPGRTEAGLLAISAANGASLPSGVWAERCFHD